jgi:hypothetical protein
MRDEKNMCQSKLVFLSYCPLIIQNFPQFYKYFSLQLSCDVQIPALFGGLEGEVLYIDTKGGVIIDRVTDLVEATVRHCHLIASGENDKGLLIMIHIFSIHVDIHRYRCSSVISFLTIYSFFFNGLLVFLLSPLAVSST